MDPPAGDGGGSSAGDRRRAVQLRGLAEKFLNVRDYVGARKFAVRAMEMDPLVEGADRVLAAADVLIAASRRINNHVDWYAVLQLDVPASSLAGRDLSDVRFQYRRLALLLRSFSSQSLPSLYEEAFERISEAWSVLSNPEKKSLYDKELAIAASALRTPSSSVVVRNDAYVRVSSESMGGGDESFWTACTNCFYVHEYKCGYEGRFLLCANCRTSFLAMKTEKPPPVVPGSDMYYCAWGLFPLGFPGGPHFVWPEKAAFETAAANGATGRQWSWEFFHGLQSSSDTQGGGAMRPNTERGKSESHLGPLDDGKRRMDGDVGVTDNQSFPADNAGRTQDSAGGAASPPKQIRRKMLAIRRRREVAHAGRSGVAVSDTDVAADDLLNRRDVDVGEGFEAAELDGENKAQDVGSSRTVGVSEDNPSLKFKELNFSLNKLDSGKEAELGNDQSLSKDAIRKRIEIYLEIPIRDAGKPSFPQVVEHLGGWKQETLQKLFSPAGLDHLLCTSTDGDWASGD